MVVLHLCDLPLQHVGVLDGLVVQLAQLFELRLVMRHEHGLLHRPVEQVLQGDLGLSQRLQLVETGLPRRDVLLQVRDLDTEEFFLS